MPLLLEDRPISLGELAIKMGVMSNYHDRVISEG
ncbi:hypothetical protein ACVIU4_000910 [Bradyrhizobium barranii subsp. barranii]|nr:hypothetical protein [Bradyrhizobium japonicum]MCP1963809.1 hypothetical protein [Bradyrhizobium japonicum]